MITAKSRPRGVRLDRILERIVLASTLGLVSMGCGGGTGAEPASDPVDVAVPAAEALAPDRTEAATVPEAERRDEEARRPGYFMGSWRGEYHATDAHSTLVVDEDGSFEAELTTTEGRSCGSSGKLWFTDGVFTMRFDYNACARGAGSGETIHRRVLYASRDEFRLVDEASIDALEKLPDGGVIGPAWTYRRSDEGD